MRPCRANAARRVPPKRQRQIEFEPGIAARFAAFDRANPHVYMAIVAICRELQREGRRHASMKLVYERLRASFDTKTQRGAEAFKLNNDFTAHYARKVMDREADLAGFFQTRERRSPGKGAA